MELEINLAGDLLAVDKGGPGSGPQGGNGGLVHADLKRGDRIVQFPGSERNSKPGRVIGITPNQGVSGHGAFMRWKPDGNKYPQTELTYEHQFKDFAREEKGAAKV